MSRWSLRPAWTIAAALCLISGCASAPAAGPLPPGSRYVAMGSSFAAGPGVSTPAPDSPAGCNQSVDNYPRQLARALGLALTDRSWGGATTDHVLTGGQFGLPPQIDALTADTRLVTVTIGGNDVRYMADLGVAGCKLRPDSFPEALRARFCTVPAGFDLEQAFAATAANLQAIAQAVHARAPQARLVFVDYVAVLPPGAPCAATPLSAADADMIRARADRLARLTAEVAARKGAQVLKASALTRDHHACAADAWIEGGVVTGDPSKGGPVPYHPRLAGMTAVAQALERMLTR